jgi:hypothetical protein
LTFPGIYGTFARVKAAIDRSFEIIGIERKALTKQISAAVEIIRQALKD